MELIKNSLIKQKICLLLLLSVGVKNADAQSRQGNLDRFFSTLSQNGQFNGNVLIAENGNVVYEKSFGYADFSNKKNNTVQTSLPIASITKTITSTAILQLKQQGKLQLEDRVTKYLPDFPYPEITIRQLLSHTSGLPNYDMLFFPLIPKNPDTVFTNKDLIPASISQKIPLVFKPGEDFTYNNVNYNILALIVEKLSGASFGSYLQANIFGPAGMTNTSLSDFFKRADKNLSKRYNFKYEYSDKVQLVDTAAEFKIANRFNFQGHGDLISTTHDLLKYDQALYNGSLLNSATLKEAFTPVKLSNGTHNIQRYALGWITNEDTSLGEIVKHDGGLPGGRTMLLRNLTKHQTIIIFDNNANNVVPLADMALKILNGEQVEKPKKSGAKFYGIALAAHGKKAADQAAKKVKTDTLNYYLNEDEMNSMGYAFLMNNRAAEAEIAFGENTRLFPGSWNVYDSYGEVLLKFGKKQDAIKMYQKSMALNPKNANGKKVLEELLK